MSIPIKPIVLIVTLFASLSSQAQGLLLGFESNITLKQDDIELIHQTVDQKIHGKPVGTTASWSNPNTRNSGTIKLLKKHTVRGLRCEKVEYTLMTTTRAVPRSIICSTAVYNRTGPGKSCDPLRWDVRSSLRRSILRLIDGLRPRPVRAYVI